MRAVFILCAVLFYGISAAQDTLPRRPVWNLSGYIKDMEWVRFAGDFSKRDATNLVHNRLNLKWNSFKTVSGRFEIRNRFYCGDDVRGVPGFREGLDNSNEDIDLSRSYLVGTSTIGHSSVERFWLEYRKTKWNLRLGRQRINWGVNSTWNPNDLFNVYNFLDFDYEERPGSDAIKGQYHLSDMSNVELAFASTKHHSIVAAKYFTNYRKYDLQWILGYYNNQITAGVGWAGSIKEVGFKGEAQYYAGTKDTGGTFNLSVEADYVFKHGWYCTSAILFNDQGINHRTAGMQAISFQVSPQNLMPARWTILASCSKEFTPLLSGTLSVVYSPVIDMLILFPSCRYNLKRNLDFDLVWQSFFARSDVFKGLSHIGFARLRWSF